MNSLIWTIEENCMGCNKCILTCPVDDANMSYVVNGKSKIHINASRCIMCGKCMEVCDHKARDYSDDTAEFFRHLMKGEQISIVAAPALKTNYPEYGRLISFLKTMGVKHVYDVALGADITIWAYLKTLEENQRKPIISQPCPAVVNYIQKYEHDLIDRLAPVQSPLVCLGIYLNKYMNVKDKLCFLSPCIAKSSEIHDENTHGYISYNVTFRKLSEYLKAHNINLSDYDEAEFEQPAVGLGEIFSKPGGLKDNLQLYDRSIWVKQMEGVEHVYKYLSEYAQRLSHNQSLPTVVDALNCDFGCNMGSAACMDVDITGVDKVSHELLMNKLDGGTPPDAENILNRFDEQLILEDFKRSYYAETLEESKEPTKEDYDEIFNSMFKFTEESRNRNCFACGYRSCHHMAKAIYNRLNHKENCIDNCSAMMLQQMHELEDQYSETELLLEEVQQQSEELYEANERMTELGNIKSDFVSTISQELRTPLTSVLAYSKIVKKRLDEVLLPEVKSDDEKVVRSVKQVADNMNNIIAEGERITALINDIMDIAKLENGTTTKKGGKISVSKIIEREIEGSQHPSTKKTLAKYLKEHAASVMTSGKGEKKILIIDSEDGTRKFLRGEFERRGYNVYEAADGIEAIECIKVIKPDLITLDVLMPSMNGFDVAAIIKNDPKTKNTPIIILSAIEDRKRGIDVGVDGYLTKPVDIAVLMGEVEKLLFKA